MVCPKCATSLYADGVRWGVRWFFHCRLCGHRWQVDQGARPGAGAAPGEGGG